METNETILTREVVVIDSHKKLGSVKALRVDCDAMAVSHYVVNNDSTGSTLVLPFEKALAVGDTFMTVQNRDDFLASNDAYSNKVLQDGYVLLKEAVFTKTGNKLSPVKGFEFDTVQGAITKIELEDGTSFTANALMFFSPEFVFIDDGAPTAAEIRSKGGAPVAPQAPVGQPVAAAAAAPAGQPQEDNAPDAPAPEDGTVSDEEIMDFLVGATLQADVASEDGEFKALKGVVLTREIIVEAAEHDAILQLTINVEV